MMMFSLFVIWLLLTNSVAPFDIVTAIFFALVITALTKKWMMPFKTMKKPFLCLRYLLIVLFDIVLANFEVAVLILGPKKRITPAFIMLPLSVKDPLQITMLASTISLTPGTVTCEVYPYMEPGEQDDKEHFLRIHALNVQDSEKLIERIKTRYEKPILEMFS